MRVGRNFDVKQFTPDSRAAFQKKQTREPGDREHRCAAGFGSGGSLECAFGCDIELEVRAGNVASRIAEIASHTPNRTAAGHSDIARTVPAPSIPTSCFSCLLSFSTAIRYGR
jgi:hypothetical protein